jgi:hypothetical protein
LIGDVEKSVVVHHGESPGRSAFQLEQSVL